MLTRLRTVKNSAYKDVFFFFREKFMLHAALCLWQNFQIYSWKKLTLIHKILSVILEACKTPLNYTAKVLCLCVP